MIGRSNTDGKGSGQDTAAPDADLTGRLRALDTELQRVRAEQKAEKAASAPDRTSAVSGLTLAYRLGAEFVAGVLVGAALGYGIDWMFGTAPWGMIVLLLLGFVAGVMNMMRAAGETGRTGSANRPK